LLERTPALDSTLLLLAGGRSRRMGRCKALLPTRDGSWLQSQLASWFQAGGKQAIAVCSPEVYAHKSWETLLPACDFLLQADSESQMCDSLKLGFAAVKSGKSVFILPVDVPAPIPSDWLAMESCVRASYDVVVPRQGGHPILLSHTLIKKLCATKESWRLDEELKKRADRKALVRCAGDFEFAEMNMNTPQDWDAWLKIRDTYA
jgi:molybdenum cofactor cytidylyltransferase